MVTHRSGQRRTETTRRRFVPFAQTVLFKILAPEHRGLSSGKRPHKGDTVWDQGIWLGRTEINPEHIHCWDNKWRNGSENNPKAGTDEKRSEAPLLPEKQGVPWDLVPNAPRRGDARNT